MYLLTEWEGRTGKYLARDHYFLIIKRVRISFVLNKIVRNYLSGHVIKFLLTELSRAGREIFVSRSFCIKRPSAVENKNKRKKTHTVTERVLTPFGRAGRLFTARSPKPVRTPSRDFSVWFLIGARERGCTGLYGAVRSYDNYYNYLYVS
jgi:hypothetical protein